MKLKLPPLGLALAFAVAGCSMTTLVGPPTQHNGVDAAKPVSGGGHLALGYAYLESGKYHPALLEFDLALAEAEGDQSLTTPPLSACETDVETHGGPSQKAEIHSASGYALYLLHRLTPDQAENANQKLMDFAEPRLRCAWELAKQANSPALEVRIKAYLGLVHARLSQDKGLDAQDAGNDGRQDDQQRDLALEKQYRQQALTELKESQSLANAHGDLALGYAAQLHLARLEATPAKRLALIKQVDSNLSGVKDANSRISLLLNIMDQLDFMQKEGSAISHTDDFLQLGFDVASRAIALAVEKRMLRAQSQGEGFLAGYYEKSGNRDKALQQTELAIRHSVDADAPDLTMVWQSNLGRLLALAGREEDAMMAYRRAMFYVYKIHNDIPLIDSEGKSSYTETLEPIYRGLADLLLRAASRKPRPEDRQELLFEAVYSLEKLKQSEMEDYFNDRCSLEAFSEGHDAPQASPIKALSPLSAFAGMESLSKTLRKATGKTAILYPVILNDRLELLLIHNGIIQQATPAQGITKERITQQAADFNDVLHNKKDYMVLSTQLYEWLFKPFAADLRSQGVDRIVYIPDGVLRLAPLSALHNGKSFVAKDYAVVINNSLQYSGTDDESRPMGKTLLAGLSKPDWSTVKLIPVAFQDYEVNKELKRRIKSGKYPKSALPPARNTDEYRELAVAGTSLKGVDKEVKLLGDILESKPLLNEDFTLQKLKNDLSGKENYEQIHIASHGYFGHSASGSFIMSWGKLLRLSEVESIMHVDSNQRGQLDLLTLSACESAKGDERAPLGFSGIAIKAKVRNTVGTLWPVTDDPTSEFINYFYRAMQETEGDKSYALQAAQNKMMEKSQYTHPKYWAAFILLGNW